MPDAFCEEKEPAQDTVTLTIELIEAVMTGGVGLARIKYNLLRGEGGMRRGWKNELVGKQIPAHHYRLLMNTVGISGKQLKRMAEVKKAFHEVKLARQASKRWNPVGGEKTESEVTSFRVGRASMPDHFP